MKIAFVTNFAAHYRVGPFTILSKYYDVEYYFYSAGDEWYWMQEQGVRGGGFNFRYLPGFRLGRTRIAPTLPLQLLFGKYEVFVKCINGRFALPVTYLIAKLRLRPFILWTGIWTRIHTPFHRVMFPMVKFLYRHADAIVVYGNHVKSYLISEGICAGKIFVATQAVDNESYRRNVSEGRKLELRKKLGIGEDKKIILCIGRLEAIKGLEYLIEAFASLRRSDAALVIVGEGSEKASLEKLVEERHLGDVVRFPGYIPPLETVAYYSVAWVYVLPSITRPEGKELWGLVVNEAFNQGVPVIATDAVGAAVGGFIQQDVNGCIVPERNSGALRDALENLLNDKELHRRLSENARRIIAGWDQENMVSGFRQAIEYVTKNNHKGVSRGR